MLNGFYVLLIVAKIAAIARREPHVKRVFKRVQYGEGDFSVERIARFFLVGIGAISQTQQEQREVEEDTGDVAIAFGVALDPIKLGGGHTHALPLHPATQDTGFTADSRA